MRHVAVNSKESFAMDKRVLLVAILLLPSALWSRNPAGVADGSDWKQYSQSYKVGWVDGFVTAMSDAQINTPRCYARFN